MQAVIALCYFCENHGPRVVLVCQPIRNGWREKTEFIHTEVDSMEADDEPPRFYGDIGSQADVLDDEPRCAACSSFGSGLGILSNDHEAETSYVSTQAAIHDHVYNMVKQACLRSLSVEISTPLYVNTSAITSSFFLNERGAFTSQRSGPPMSKDIFEKDGVVLFGDDIDGYVLSHTFRLKDAKARGFHRSYSLIVVSRDKLMLLTNYDFFLGGFAAMIAKLQSMAEDYFLTEQSMDMDLRVAAQSGRATFLPQQFYPRNVTLDTSRSLTEIVNNKDVFILLHRQMLYLLKTQTMLEQDTVLEGVPTQDMLVQMELDQSMEEHDLLISLSDQQSYVHFCNLKVIANRLHATNEHLLASLVWQVVIGEQIVVRSDNSAVRRSFLLALANLLPLGCVKLTSNAAAYIHGYKYNFLGVPLSVEVPTEVRDDVFEMDILEELNGHDQFGGALFYSIPTSLGHQSQGEPYQQHSDRSKQFEMDISDGASSSNAPTLQVQHHTDRSTPASSLVCEDLSRFVIVVRNMPVAHTKTNNAPPLILKRYLDLLLHPMLNVCTLESSIRSTRNDWLNKAKLIFQLRHQKEGIDIGRIIRIIKCGPEDSPVLLFWQSGLSRRYKQAVLNTINNANGVTNCRKRTSEGSNASAVAAQNGVGSGRGNFFSFF